MVRKLSRRHFIGQARSVALATPFLSLVGCSDDGENQLTSLGGKTMGTTYSVKLVEISPAIDKVTLAQEINDLLEGVDQKMSTYRPDSELSSFNTSTAETWMPVSIDTLSVIEEALRVNQLTAGAFDPTVGPVVDLWGFGPEGGNQRIPSPEEIANRRNKVGLAMIKTRAEPSALAKRKSGLRMDLSGVAKGFGVDKVAQHLEARGLTNYLVEVGGELRAHGSGPGGRSWRVGIEKPTAVPGDLQQIVDLNDAALATSGDYRLFFERDGHRYSHIIDPQTGRPVSHDLASATVVATTTMEADALSTALLVLGPDAGMRLAAEHNIAAFFVMGRSGDFTTKQSPAFERHIKA